MAFSDRRIGFSTGALAKGDFQHALALLERAAIPIVEISALRETELPTLSEGFSHLDLSRFEYVSFHAPSRLHDLSEDDVVRLLRVILDLNIPVVVHPDTIRRPEAWRPFRNLLLIENLDKRKPTARTAAELDAIFDVFPDAGFCLDVAHARQVDPTMAEATRMLRLYGSRLCQIHASGLNANSTHGPMSGAASFAFSQISHLIPSNVPIILESPVSEQSIRAEVNFAREAFSPWLQRLRAEIDDVFDLKAPSLRRSQVEAFLRLLSMTGTKLSDFERVVSQLPSGGAYKPGSLFLSATEILARLTEPEKMELRQYLLDRITSVANSFPDLPEHFKYQFS